MEKLKSNAVFTPGRFTTHTYVNRVEGDVAKKLRKYIRWGAFLVTLLGPTKMGKTVLAEKEAPGALSISGNAIQDVSKFWLKFANYLDIPAEVSSSKVTGDRSRWGFMGNLAFFGAEIGGEHHVDKSKSTSNAIDAEQAVLEAIKMICGESGGNVTVIIDDFHFVPTDVREPLVQALKSAAYAGATIIVITLPHRRADITDLVMDMGGRTATIEVTPWEPAELQQIPSLGFPKLALRDPDNVGQMLAASSYGSPQIMQQLCLELVDEVNETYETGKEWKDVVQPASWPDFYRSIRDEGAIKWVEKFISGPPVRGTARKQHALVDGRQLDGYQVIVAALKELGPPLTLRTTDLTAKIDEMIEGSTASAVAVGQKLSQMSFLASKPLRAKLKEVESEEVIGTDLVVDPGPDETKGQGFAAGGNFPQPVFEYAPDASRENINILEPYVAYTIRWHLGSLLPQSTES